MPYLHGSLFPSTPTAMVKNKWQISQRCEYLGFEREYSQKYSDDMWQHSPKVRRKSAETKRKEMLLMIKMNLYQNQGHLLSYSPHHRRLWAGAGCGCSVTVSRLCSLPKAPVSVHYLWLLFLCASLSLWGSDVITGMGRLERFVCKGCAGDGKATGKDAFKQNEGTSSVFII